MIGSLLDRIVEIDAPLPFLSDQSIRYVTRVLCMTIQVGLKLGFNKDELLSPAYLAGQLGKSEATITKALEQLKASPWPVDKPFEIDEGVATVRVSNVLILDKTLTNCTKILFCLVLTLKKRSNGFRETRYSELHRLFGIGFCTVKRCIAALRAGRWLITRQKNKHAPLRIKTDFPLKKPLMNFNEIIDETDSTSSKAELMEGTSKGERLLLATLDLLVDSDYYDDHYSPKYLVNPDTGHLMHHDRMYHKEGVAIEFNGSQHYYATERFSKKVVAEQRRRDNNKRRINKDRVVAHIEFTAEDLVIETIMDKLRGILPLRELPKTTIAYLNSRLEGYRRACGVHTQPQFADSTAGC